MMKIFTHLNLLIMGTKKTKKMIHIDASVSEVWNALTDPAIVKQYFFGTTVDSDWKEGSPITYSGEWKGKVYQDKGIIKKIDKERILSHTYWSNLSGIADIPDNYATVTYELHSKGDGTTLTITQENKKGTEAEKAYENSGDNWEMVMQKMKDLLEKEYETRANEII